MRNKTRPQIDKPLNQHSKKQLRYAEIYAKGVYSAVEAARLAGYSEATAAKQSYAWIGETRAESEYPVLFEYYEKLRKKNLREFEITADNIAKEMAIIAFSDLSNFVLLPSREQDTKARRARLLLEAVGKVESYRFELDRYEERKHAADMNPHKVKEPEPPAEPTALEYSLAGEYNRLTIDERLDLEAIASYKAGSFKLKNIEDIPPALLPALSEITETRNGVSIKLHSKMDALDKLARWKKMYIASTEEEESNVVTSIKINVQGSRSPLMKLLEESEGSEEDTDVQEENDKKEGLD